MLYTFCSECGYRFGRSAGGTETELECPKCGAKIKYSVIGPKVTVEILEHSSKKPAKRLIRYSEELASTSNKQ